MIELNNDRHHVEFYDLPNLKPMELYVLYKLSRYLEPYTNKLIMSCDVHIVKDERIIQRLVKSVPVRAADLPDIAGCSAMTVNRIMKTLRELKIVALDTSNGRTYYINPKYVRAHNSLGGKNLDALFEQELPQDPPARNAGAQPSFDADFEDVGM